MKTVRSESDLQPRHYPELKRLIQNVRIDHHDDGEENEEYMTRVTNRKVGVISSNMIKEKSCSHRFQQPIILEKKSRGSEFKSTRKVETIQDVPRMEYSPKPLKTARSIQKFQPIMIPTHDKKISIYNKLSISPKIPNKQQIEIHLQNSDKDCLKKLFKKIKSLTEQLHDSEKKNAALSTEIQFLRNSSKRIQEIEKQNMKLKGEIEKLKIELSNTSSRTIEKIIERPVEVIKHVPVEKIVQIQVPKYIEIEGPGKVVEKIVEVPVGKGGSHEIKKETVRETHYRDNQRGMPENLPNYKSNTDYHQYPIYKNTPYPFQVPVHIPVYIQKPLFGGPSDSYGFHQTRSSDYTDIHKQNALLNRQNEQLYRTIDILKKHNQQKNREVQSLINSQLISPPISTRTHQMFSFR